MACHLPGTIERTSIFSEVRNPGRSKRMAPNWRVNVSIFGPPSNHPAYIGPVHPFLGECLVSSKLGGDGTEEGSLLLSGYPRGLHIGV